MLTNRWQFIGRRSFTSLSAGSYASSRAVEAGAGGFSAVAIIMKAPMKAVNCCWVYRKGSAVVCGSHGGGGRRGGGDQ